MSRKRKLFPLAHIGLLVALALVNQLALADKSVRVVTWNVQTVGDPGTPEFNATAAVLGRIDADVVAIAEVASEADRTNLGSLAFALGYRYSAVAPAGPFGALRTAFMSMFPITTSTAWSSSALSTDAAANDLTRYILEAYVDVTGSGDPLRLIVNHWKSGTANADEFRRALESYRVSQAASDSSKVNLPLVIGRTTGF